MATLLFIDDDKEVLVANKKYFSEKGFNIFVASNPIDGINYAKKVHPDCILLDMMMPELSGIEVCNEIRTFSSVPIIFVTGKGDEDDKIDGLVSGADDYIVKPYSLRELEARINIHIKRTKQMKATMQSNKNVLTFKDLKIDKIEHKAYYKGEDLCLANKEYMVLLHLASHPNEEVSFSDLGLALFGVPAETDRRSVMVNVSRLRKKMAIDSELENMIETVWSKGYKFIAK